MVASALMENAVRPMTEARLALTVLPGQAWPPPVIGRKQDGLHAGLVEAVLWDGLPWDVYCGLELMMLSVGANNRVLRNCPKAPI
jgi:hypothetical protein